jgi:hypothetical protein
MATAAARLRVAVVGAGPAGVCAAAAIAQAGGEVVWIDRAATLPSTDCDHNGAGVKTETFETCGLPTGFGTVGRFGHFAAVHSNTKMDLVRKWFGRGPATDKGPSLFDRLARDHPALATAVDDLVGSARQLPHAWSETHGKVDPSEGWCYLGPIANVLQCATDALLSGGYSVTRLTGTVARVQRRHHRDHQHQQHQHEYQHQHKQPVGGSDGNAQCAAWVVTLEEAQADVEVHAVVLATGSVPRAPPHRAVCAGVREVPSERAIDRAALARLVRPGETVGVVGNSHTGALVAMNLVDLGATVRVYAERPLRLAQWESPPAQYVVALQQPYTPFSPLVSLPSSFHRTVVKLSVASCELTRQCDHQRHVTTNAANDMRCAIQQVSVVSDGSQRHRSSFCDGPARPGRRWQRSSSRQLLRCASPATRL